MKFKESKSIYLQIADRIMDEIEINIFADSRQNYGRDSS